MGWVGPDDGGDGFAGILRTCLGFDGEGAGLEAGADGLAGILSDFFGLDDVGEADGWVCCAGGAGGAGAVEGSDKV